MNRLPMPLLLTLASMGVAIGALALGHAIAPSRSAVWPTSPEQHSLTATISPSAIVPRFSLVDGAGHRVSETTYRGRLELVYFGYSFCPDICPTDLGYQARVLRALGADATQVVPLFVTVDPARDTPSHLSQYVALFDSRLIGLTGSEADIAAAAHAFGAWYQRVPLPTSATSAAGSVSASATSYLIDHTSATYLVDRTGRLVDHLDAHDAVDRSVAIIRSYLRP